MPSKHDLQPLLDVRQNQLGVVFADSDSIDTKALAILGANVAIVLFVDTLHVATWKFVLVYSLFVISLVLDVISIWPRKYQDMSVDSTAHPSYLHLNANDLVLQLLADTEDAIKFNSQLNRKRMHFCISSIVLTGLGILALLCIL